MVGQTLRGAPKLLPLAVPASRRAVSTLTQVFRKYPHLNICVWCSSELRFKKHEVAKHRITYVMHAVDLKDAASLAHVTEGRC